MKSIYTLIPDIQFLLKQRGWFTEELAEGFTHVCSKALQSQYEPRTKAPTLRLSQMGQRCPCALWHSIHSPGEAEQLPPWAEFKFSFGHVIEALALTLAKAAGHSVVGEQDELSLDGILGHRDGVVDGAIVDVKSTSSRYFQKFKDGSIRDTDSFGYLDQLDGYVVASYEDPLVTVKDRGFILAIDKTLGHMCLYEHRIRESSIRSRVQGYKEIVGRSSPPKCTCETIAEGKSGNIKLDTVASYNAFKYCCFPDCRTFLYASGPVYLTKVVRLPEVKELDKYGKVVYNS